MVRASGKQLGIALGIIGAYVLYKNTKRIYYDLLTEEVGYFDGIRPEYSYRVRISELPREPYDYYTRHLSEGYQKLVDENYTVTIIDRLARKRVKVVPDSSSKTGYRGENPNWERKDTVLATMPLERFLKTKPVGFSYGPVKDNGWEYGIVESNRKAIIKLEPYIGNDGPVYQSESPNRYIFQKVEYAVVGPNHKGFED